MRRVTIRLSEKQHDDLNVLAQKLGTDISSALRSLISTHQRTQLLLDAFTQTRDEILKAVAASREATTENLKRAMNHLSQLLEERK